MTKRAFAMMIALAGAAAVPAAQGQAPAASAPPKVSPKEGEAIKKVANAKTPDEKIAAVESLITGFADTSDQICLEPLELYNDFKDRRVRSFILNGAPS